MYQAVIFSFKVSQNFILYESAEDSKNAIGTDRLLRPRGGRVQFLKRVKFGGSVLKMYKV